MRRFAFLFALIAATGAAQAQTPPAEEPDLIGDLLAKTPEAPAERAPAEVMPTAPSLQPAPAYVPPAPQPAAVSPFSWRPSLKAPVHVDETGKSPDSPLTARDRDYEARMRATFAAAEGMQGPLDGRWVIRDAGIEVYDLQVVDKGQGSLEGAWLDPRRRGAAGASGFIDDIAREGLTLTVRFRPRPGVDPTTLSLQAGPEGAWNGVMVERGERREVGMKRN